MPPTRSVIRARILATVGATAAVACGSSAGTETGRSTERPAEGTQAGAQQLPSMQGTTAPVPTHSANTPGLATASPTVPGDTWIDTGVATPERVTTDEVPAEAIEPIEPTVIAPAAFPPGPQPESPPSEFVAGPGYWHRTIPPSLASALCDSGEPGQSTYYIEVCLAQGDGGVACSEPTVRDIATKEYACGLGFFASSVCGPTERSLADLQPQPALDDAGLDAGLDAAASQDGNPKPSTYSDDTACCWVIRGDCAIGRPFMIQQRPQRADALPSASNDWHAPGLRTQRGFALMALSSLQRQHIGQLWLRDACSEHASVASFSRFVLQCLALGAPAELVTRALRAAEQEVEHARLSFALAARYLGQTHEPGPLDLRGALGEDSDVLSVARSVAAEACIAETVSAVLLAQAAHVASDPIVRGVLAQVAEEELEHAELGWHFLAWVVRQHGVQVVTELSPVFANAEHYVGFGALSHTGQPDPALRAHGCLTADEQQQLSRLALSEIVRPAAARLFGQVS